MEIYGLRTCDTCRKAIRSLPGATFVDVRDDGVPQAVLLVALATFDDDLVNRRSTTWRGLTEVERRSAPDRLLVDHPTLMKRPLIVDQERMFLGWTKEVQLALGVSQA